MPSVIGDRNWGKRGNWNTVEEETARGTGKGWGCGWKWGCFSGGGGGGGGVKGVILIDDTQQRVSLRTLLKLMVSPEEVEEVLLL